MMIKMVLLALVMVPAVAMAKAAEKAKAKTHIRKLASEEVKCSGEDGKGMDIDYIIQKAEAAATCEQAVQQVVACNFGSSQDGATTEAAIANCEKKTGKLADKDLNLKKDMLARCVKICDPNREGTECLSRQAFCRLDVAKFIAGANNVD